MAPEGLRQHPVIPQEALYERLFSPDPNKRAPHLKNKIWHKGWTPSYFETKVLQHARKRAGLDPRAKGGAPRKE